MPEAKADTDPPKTPRFQWNDQRSQVAILLAEGRTQTDVAKELNLDRKTLYTWLCNEEFSAEVDRLSLMMGIASRAERLRIAQRVARQKVKDDGTVTTDKDLLDWLKFAQSETDGIKLDLTALTEIQASVADSGQAGVRSEARSAPESESGPDLDAPAEAATGGSE